MGRTKSFQKGTGHEKNQKGKRGKGGWKVTEGNKPTNKGSIPHKKEKESGCYHETYGRNEGKERFEKRK